MRSATLALLFATLAGPPAAAVAAVAPVGPIPLSLAWGVVAEPATAGAHSPGQVAEHLEFLQAHGWRAVRAGALGDLGHLGDTAGGERPVLLTFDDPASALRYVVPLLDLYRMPAVVTVSPSQVADPALAPVLAGLAASPWMELLPRVEADPAAGAPAVRCGAAHGADTARRREDRLERLSRTLAAQVARLREITGAAPAAVAWAPGTWSGSEEAVAASLGLTVSLPTFTGMPPPLDPPHDPLRLARYAVPPWAGIWALVQASVRWDPRDYPVRFVEVDAAWICAGGDPQARIARVVEVVRRLGLNGVRLLPGDRAGAWFETTAAPVLGDVAGPLSRALRDAGARWVVVDFPPASGDPGLDVALAADLARAVDADVAVLPAAGPQDRLGDTVGNTVRYVRPAARLAWRDREGEGERAFHLAPAAPGAAAFQGLTVSSTAVAAADAEASRRAIAGWEWIGLPVELAEAGLRISLRSLAAFALPR